MAFTDRNLDSAGNARKSRGPITRQKSRSSESSRKEEENMIRVGGDYQAIIPELTPADQRRPEQNAERDLLIWSPTTDIPDYKLDEYISLAKEKHKYSVEQALGMLLYHKYDLEQAVLELPNFTPLPRKYKVKK